MPTRTITTKFYEFDQNNSGGCYENDLPAGIGETVWIEATDFEAANARAETIGLYFDGCSNGRDCECCGDRWSRRWREDGVDEPAASSSRPVFVHPIGEPFYRLPATPTPEVPA